MRVDFHGWLPTPTTPVSEAIAAVRAGMLRDPQPPMLLGYTPVVRGNPYQALIYREFVNSGIMIAPITIPWKFAEYAQLTNLAPSVAVHIHWTSFVLDGVSSRGQARGQVRRLVDSLDALRDAGVKTVFTVHNVIPHDATFVEEEIEIQQALIERADVVHVMSSATIDVLGPMVRFDLDRILVSPHPSYVGAYPDYVTRDDARLSLRIDSDDIVYVLFGALKAYKGLDRLLESVETASAETGRRRTLLVAGRPDRSPESQRFVNRALAHPNTLVYPHRVATEHVQYFLRAADIGLAPYHRVLNSGAALLYRTFDLPVLAARSEALWEGLDHDIAELDSGGSVEALASAMIRADRLLGEKTQHLVRERLTAFDPVRLSAVFAAGLRERLAPGPLG